MHNKAHIGLVDAHAERDGGRHHNAILLQKAVLVARALARLHACMIGHRFKSIILQPTGHFLGPVA